MIDNIKHDYLDLNMHRSLVAEKYNCSIASFKAILQFNKITKDRKNVHKLISKSLLEIPPDKLDIIVKQRKKTRLEKYGDENYVNREKAKQTSLKRYGVEVPSQSEQVKEEVRQRNIVKYGVDSPNKLELYKQRVRDSNLKKYGLVSPMQTEKVKQKISNTQMSKSPEIKKLIRQKFTKTCLDRYGVTNPFAAYSVKKKIKQTCLERYGVPYYCMSNNFYSHHYVISKINLRFASLLESNDIQYEHEFKLNNYIYDFKIDKYLIEINPTYTHNSIKGPFYYGKRVKAKDKNYHYDKSVNATKNGFHCIHVFDWDDWNQIIDLINSNKQKIYARNCKLKEINKNDTDYFLNQFHLQNTCRNQTYRYGLYFNDELIQIMTFGKPRYNKNYEYELLRLCSKSDVKVIGGSQRLFKHFLKELNPKSIISYCDYSKFSGEVYNTLNFKQINHSINAIWYKDKHTKIIYDSLLRQRGFDQLFNTSYGKNTSNENLMIEYNWLKVHTAGQKTYVITFTN